MTSVKYWKCKSDKVATRQNVFTSKSQKHFFDAACKTSETFCRRDRSLGSFLIQKTVMTKLVHIPPLVPDSQSHALFTASPGNLLVNHVVVLQLRELHQRFSNLCTWAVEVQPVEKTCFKSKKRQNFLKHFFLIRTDGWLYSCCIYVLLTTDREVMALSRFISIELSAKTCLYGLWQHSI